jgi:hypothetical protein
MSIFSTHYGTTNLFSMFSGTALGGRILAASGNDYQGLIVFAAVSYLASFIILFWRRCAADGAMFG